MPLGVGLAASLTLGQVPPQGGACADDRHGAREGAGAYLSAFSQMRRGLSGSSRKDLQAVSSTRRPCARETAISLGFSSASTCVRSPAGHAPAANTVPCAGLRQQTGCIQHRSLEPWGLILSRPVALKPPWATRWLAAAVGTVQGVSSVGCCNPPGSSDGMQHGRIDPRSCGNGNANSREFPCTTFGLDHCEWEDGREGIHHRGRTRLDRRPSMRLPWK